MIRKIIIGIISVAIAGLAVEPQTVYAPTLDVNNTTNVITNVGEWLKNWVGIKIRLLFFLS